MTASDVTEQTYMPEELKAFLESEKLFNQIPVIERNLSISQRHRGVNLSIGLLAGAKRLSALGVNQANGFIIGSILSQSSTSEETITRFSRALEMSEEFVRDEKANNTEVSRLVTYITSHLDPETANSILQAYHIIKPTVAIRNKGDQPINASTLIDFLEVLAERHYNDKRLEICQTIEKLELAGVAFEEGWTKAIKNWVGKTAEQTQQLGDKAIELKAGLAKLPAEERLRVLTNIIGNPAILQVFEGTIGAMREEALVSGTQQVPGSPAASAEK